MPDKTKEEVRAPPRRPASFTPARRHGGVTAAFPGPGALAYLTHADVSAPATWPKSVARRDHSEQRGLGAPATPCSARASPFA